MQRLCVHQISIWRIPTMAEGTQTRPTEFGPGEMQQGPTVLIQATARDTGSVHIGDPASVQEQTSTHSATAFELVMHVSENHQIWRPSAGHPIESDGQILIPPVDSGSLPVAPAGTVGL